jgi:hypothetical protein
VTDEFLKPVLAKCRFALRIREPDTVISVVPVHITFSADKQCSTSLYSSTHPEVFPKWAQFFLGYGSDVAFFLHLTTKAYHMSKIFNTS